MYSYLFNICTKWSHEPIVSILIKAKDRFTPYKSIFVKISGEQEEWIANEQALYDIKDLETAFFFEWLEWQPGLVPYHYIHRYNFAPFELYTAVKESEEYDITVETNEPVDDFGDPGTYFKDMYKGLPPGVVF